MTTEPPEYQFRFERVQRALINAAGGVLEEDDLEEQWHDLVTDGSDSALLLSDDEAARFSNLIASGRFTGFDPRHYPEQAEALERLKEHDDCTKVIKQLTAQRDDVLAALCAARSYAFNDIYEGEWGDLYLEADRFLDRLRPTLPGAGKYMRLNVFAEPCSECRDPFGHADWCPVEQEEEAVDERRNHAIASHLHCLLMGRALLEHTARCLERVEKVALRTRNVTTEEHDVQVVDPHKVLAVLRLADLNIAIDALDPGTIATHIYPPIEDVPYCGSDDYDHYEPHRACRYLVN